MLSSKTKKNGLNCVIIIIVLTTKTKDQLNLISTLASTFEKENISYWVAGGFALDGYLGFVSREHYDVDFIIESNSKEKVAELITSNNIYDSLIITQWRNHKILAFDHLKNIFIDFAPISITASKAVIKILNEEFSLPSALFPLDRKVTLEGIQFRAMDPTLIYATKLTANRLQDHEKEKIDQEDIAKLKQCVNINEELVQKILPTTTAMSNLSAHLR